MPYGLYRVSVPVKRCTLLLPIPLLPICAVRPVQNPSACTTAHINFTYNSTPPMCRTASTEPQCQYNGALHLYLYLYSSYVPYGALYLYLYFPYVPYGLYRTSVPVQRCTLTLPIPLLPPCVVRPLQNISACTTVNFIFTYISTSHICRTACTEPRCLYNGAL